RSPYPPTGGCLLASRRTDGSCERCGDCVRIADHKRANPNLHFFSSPSGMRTKGEAYMAAIEVRNLHKRYGKNVAAQDVSFTVERGEIFGIIGPNGAGKTTTVECIEGLRTPDSGTVTVLGLDPQRDHAELRQRVGAQLQ